MRGSRLPRQGSTAGSKRSTGGKTVLILTDHSFHFGGGRGDGPRVAPGRRAAHGPAPGPPGELVRAGRPLDPGDRVVPVPSGTFAVEAVDHMPPHLSVDQHATTEKTWLFRARPQEGPPPGAEVWLTARHHAIRHGDGNGIPGHPFGYETRTPSVQPSIESFHNRPEHPLCRIFTCLHIFCHTLLRVTHGNFRNRLLRGIKRTRIALEADREEVTAHPVQRHMKKARPHGDIHVGRSKCGDTGTSYFRLRAGVP